MLGECENEAMPVEVHFQAPSLFFMRAFDQVTVQEVRAAIEEMLDRPELLPGAALLIHNREVTSVRTIDEVAVITAAFSRLFARGVKRVAILTDRELEPSQVFASFASTEGADARVFRDEQAARAWIQAS